MQSAHQAYQRWGRDRQDDLVRDHLPLVYSMAQRILRSASVASVELGDLVGAGVLGLYKALDRYDVSKATTFGTYATPYVRGAILDELNKLRQIPRSIRDKHTKVRNALQNLTHELLREPSDAEVAEHLGISVSTYGEWLGDLGWTTVFSVEELEAAGTLNVEDTDVDRNPEAEMSERERKAELVASLKQCSEREQQVLYLYYQEELTLKEISYILELSESQISRIHSKTLLKLRGMMAES